MAMTALILDAHPHSLNIIVIILGCGVLIFPFIIIICLVQIGALELKKWEILINAFASLLQAFF